MVMSPTEHPEKLCTLLKSHGVSVSIVQNIQMAFSHLNLHNSAFILIDLSLKGAVSFLKMVATISYNPPPYIMVANRYSCSLAYAETLNLGADVCLEKPLDAEEVFAVIKAVLRRSNRLDYSKLLFPSPCVEHGGLQIDPLRRDVNIDGKPVILTVKEFDILHFLASHSGVVFSKEQIYEQVWNDDYQFATTSVSDHISSLRKKLGLKPRDGRYIQTVHGAGYRFVEPK